MNLVKSSIENICSFESYVGRLNLKIADERVLEPYEVQEAFQKYLLHKIEKRKLDATLKRVQTELDSSSSPIAVKRLNDLSYLVHMTSSEREAFTQMVEASDPGQVVSLPPYPFAMAYHQIKDRFTCWNVASKLQDDYYQEIRNLVIKINNAIRFMMEVYLKSKKNI